MSCKEIQSALIDYHYGELPQERHRSISLHLPECGPCARAYCQLQIVTNELDDELLESPSPRVEEALAARVKKSFHQPWWRRALEGMRHPLPLYQWAAMTTLLLLIFALASGVWSIPRAETVVEPTLRDYDASRIVRVDPHTL